MITEDIEKLIRKYLSTGLAVVIILVSPDAEATDTGSRSRDDRPSVVMVEPDDRGTDRSARTRDDTDQVEERSQRSDRSQTRSRERTDDRGRAADERTTGPRKGESSPRTRRGDDTGETADDRSTIPSERSGADRDRDEDLVDRGDSDGEGRTAAEVHGWGEPNRVEEFDSEESLADWHIYDGPGHAGNGRRTPDAVSVENGVLKITGNSKGETAGMAWLPGQKYGRWEGRVKAPASDPSYNALLLLWPDAENFPVGGEIDFMEMMDPSRQVTDIFIHYGPDNSQVNGQVQIDATEWHNWAVEWTPEAITAYVDGEEWYRTTDTSIFPPGPMHLCIQLDWFPKGGSVKESVMYVDWVRQYPLDASETDARGDDDRGNGRDRENGTGSTGSRAGGGTATDTGDDDERSEKSRGRSDRAKTTDGHSGTSDGSRRDDDTDQGSRPTERSGSETRQMSGTDSGPIREGRLAGAVRRVHRAPIE